MSMDDLLSEWNAGQHENAGNEIWKSIPGMPAFSYMEIAQLYAWGFDLPERKLEEILALPRQSLVADLELVLKDAALRFEAYLAKDQEKEGEFPLPLSALAFPAHALFLLAELESERSLPAVLEFLANDAALLKYYLSDFESVDLWPVLFKLGKQDLPALLTFAKDAKVDQNYRKLAAEAVAQVLWHYGARKAEVVFWFEEFLAHYLENGSLEADGLLLGDAIAELASLRAAELLPAIQALFERNLVDTAACGSFEEVNGDMQEHVNNWAKVEEKDLFETYRHFRESWELHVDESEEAAGNFVSGGAFLSAGKKKKPLASFNPKKRPIQKGEKTGRNDLCPCGSGLKYKKCHGV